jgi:hypothetical protein
MITIVRKTRIVRPIAGIQPLPKTNLSKAAGLFVEWWGGLPAPMKEAIEQFRTQLPGCD